jgi:DNA-binding response OmpR family regulator
MTRPAHLQSPAVSLDEATVMAEPDEVIHMGNLEIRPAEYQLLADGRRVGMTVREFETFYALAMRADRVVARAEIYRVVWGGHMAHRDRSVDVFVRKVRRKLARAAPEWSYIHTHFGIGYRLSPERTPESSAG